MDRIQNHPILGESPEGRKVTFYYDGNPLEGIEGEPIMAALKVNGVMVHRYTAKKHEPLGPIIPLIGILGTSYMIFYISNDMHERLMIWAVAGVSILALGIYAYFWTKFKIKMPVWKSVPIEKVMAMDDSRYYALRRKTGIW